MKLLHPADNKKGQELCDYLRKELGVPESSKWFEVRFAVGEIITVKCEYFVEEDEE